MQPISVPLARDIVTEKLQEAIYEGVLRPGDELIQQKISEELGVSRMPVREALAALQNAGLAEVLPNKHVIVKEITRAMINEDFEIRVLLECRAAEKACKAAENFDRLHEIHNRIKQYSAMQSFDSFKSLNTEFHRELWHLARSPKLEKMLDGLWHLFPVYFPASLADQVNCERNIAEHQTILDAMDRRNAEQAAKAVEMHISSNLNRILERLPKEDHIV